MFHSARSFDPPDERGNFEKVDKNIIARRFVLVRVDEAAIGNGGDGMFAALPAAMPEIESSTTRHSLGARPSFSTEVDVEM